MSYLITAQATPLPAEESRLGQDSYQGAGIAPPGQGAL
jgi:hypothetical protein